MCAHSNPKHFINHKSCKKKVTSKHALQVTHGSCLGKDKNNRAFNYKTTWFLKAWLQKNTPPIKNLNYQELPKAKPLNPSMHEYS